MLGGVNATKVIFLVMGMQLIVKSTAKQMSF